MRIKLSKNATLFLRNEHRYLSQFNPRAADNVLRQLRAALRMLAEYPQAGSVVVVRPKAVWLWAERVQERSSQEPNGRPVQQLPTAGARPQGRLRLLAQLAWLALGGYSQRRKSDDHQREKARCQNGLGDGVHVVTQLSSRACRRCRPVGHLARTPHRGSLGFHAR